MEAGFLDRVELEGDSYQVQTELVDPESGRVRSVVFHGGQVVAVNEARLHGVDGGVIDPQVVRDLVGLHHEVVLEGFVRRIQGFAERTAARVDRPAAPVVAPAPVAAGPAPDLELDIPPIPEDPALADSIEVRRMFAEFRAQATVAAADADASTRVGHAAAALTWLHDQPRFGRARIDEQARVHLLMERTGEWEAAGRPPAGAEQIWTEVIVFCAYVAEVNNRADLIVFDRQLLCWGLRALRARGPSRSTLKPMQWLRGRDDELDALLGAGDAQPAEVWRQVLERLSAALGTG